MHRLTVLYKRPADADHFREYYVNTHLPLAAKLPELRHMRYSFEVAGVGGPSSYFAIWEGEFDSADAMGAALASDKGKAVAADVANYATGGVEMLHFPVH